MSHAAAPLPSSSVTLRLAQRPDTSGAILVIVAVWNLPDIEVAYGAGVAQEFRAAVCERATRLLDASGANDLACWDGLHLVLPIARPVGSLDDEGGGDAAHDALCATATIALTGTPIPIGEVTLFAAATVKAAPLDAPDGPLDDAAVHRTYRTLMRRLYVERPRIEPLAPTEGARTGYQSNMACAGVVAACLRSEASLYWKPVTCVSTEAPLSFEEGVLRLVDTEGRQWAAPQAVRALEAIGLVRGLDAHVADLGLSRLMAGGSETISISISAQSAILDDWWRAALDTLDREPALARRLIIEIRDGPLPGIGLATDFARQIQAMGGRIAVCDPWHESLHRLSTLKPDIIRIDATRYRTAEGAPAIAEARLRNVVELALSFAPQVVIDGIDEQERLELSAEVRAQARPAFDAHHDIVVAEPTAALASTKARRRLWLVIALLSAAACAYALFQLWRFLSPEGAA